MADARADVVLQRLDSVLHQEFGLGELGRNIVTTCVRSMVSEPENGKRARVKQWILLLMNGKLRPPKHTLPPHQTGCPEIIPQLTARPFWTPKDSSVIARCVEKLTLGAGAIREELLAAVKQRKIFQPYRAPNWVNPSRLAQDGIGSLGHDSGDWNVLYLYLHNVDFSSNRAQFPKTMEIVDALPNLHHHVFFSALDRSTHVAPHSGPTNKKIRIHLPLLVPPGRNCAIRVGEETRCFEEGECVAFDDSFEHEAWNNHPSRQRICLIVDIWHPDLSAQEISLLKFLEKGKMKKVRQNVV